MVVARLWGGLGNQMFQYAAGLALARRLETELLLDPSQCHADVNRPYELSNLRISGRIWSNQERRRAERFVRLTRPTDCQTREFAKIMKASLRGVLRGRFTYFEDQNQGYQTEINGLRGHVYMAGTWACSDYFEPAASVVREEFRFKEEPDEQNVGMLERITASGCAVCVHVRRGDYVSVDDTSRRFGVCSLDYYQTAAEQIASQCSEPTGFVFSDDPKWTRENLKLPFKAVYVAHNVGQKNFEDLRLMSACQHFIIANSTFSWWGAWLSGNLDKIVIAPRRWRIDSTRIADPVPANWIRV